MSDPASQPAAGRQKLSRSEAARHASLVRWGKEQPFAARLAAVREARKKKGGGKRGKKPAAPKKTPEQRQAEKEQAKKEALAAQRAERDRLLTEAGIDANTQGALVDAADGNALTSANGAKLAALGLAEQAKDGTYRLTAAGRGVVDAAMRGDAERVSRTMSKAKDAATPDDAAAGAEKEEKPKGGGGGGGKEKPTAEEKQQAKAEERAKTASATAASVGMRADELDALRTAADSGGADNAALRAAGLIDDAGNATDQGRRALVALERGDVRTYRAALQDAQARMEREQAAATREKERGQAAQQRKAEQQRREAERESERQAREAERKRRGRDRRGATVEVKTDMDIDALESEVKAGRMLSQSNAEALLDAYEATDAALDRLYAILEAAGLMADDPEEDGEQEAGEPVEMLEGKAGGVRSPGEAIVGNDGPELLTAMPHHDGSHVKALDGDRVGALAIRFGSVDEPDMSAVKDYFTRATDYWLDAWDRRPMLYHHALDEATADAPRIGTWTKADVTPEGIWLEGQLDRSHRYYGAIKELIRRGALRVSSDSAPHLVLRERQGNGTHEVKRWPLLAASLTPTPAEPRLTPVSLKAILAELGDDAIDDGTEATPPQDAREVPDQRLKADADHARRLLVELDVLELEATAP